MESIKRLEEAAKACIKDLREQESKYSIKEGDIHGLETKKQALDKEIHDLQAKKAELVSFLGMAKSNLDKEHEAKLREHRAKNDALDTERGKIKSLEVQAEMSKKASDESKEKYDKLYKEYEKKLDDINQKREAVLAALK